MHSHTYIFSFRIFCMYLCDKLEDFAGWDDIDEGVFYVVQYVCS